MAFFDFQGAVAGAGSGAALGSFGTGKGALIGGGIGALAGGFGLFGKKRKQRKIDIGAELARIRGLFESQRSQAEASIRRASGQQRGRVANNLAARGILRSPVSENSFQRVREAELAAVGQSNAQIGAAQANAESRLLSQLLGLRFAQEQQADQRRASLFGTLGSISGNLLLANLMKGGGQEYASGGEVVGYATALLAGGAANAGLCLRPLAQNLAYLANC